MRKKILQTIAYALTFSMLLGIVGCANKEPVAESSIASSETESFTEIETTTEEETTTYDDEKAQHIQDIIAQLDKNMQNKNENSSNNNRDENETTTKKPSGNGSSSTATTTAGSNNGSSNSKVEDETFVGPYGETYNYKEQDAWLAAWDNYRKAQEQATTKAEQSDDDYEIIAEEYEVEYDDGSVIRYTRYRKTTGIYFTYDIPQNDKTLITRTFKDGSVIQYYYPNECFDNMWITRGYLGHESGYDYTWKIVSDWDSDVFCNDYYSVTSGGGNSKNYIAVCYVDSYSLYNLVDGTQYKEITTTEPIPVIALCMEVRDLTSLGYTEYNAYMMFNTEDEGIDVNGYPYSERYWWHITEDKANEIIEAGINDGSLDKDAIKQIKTILSSKSTVITTDHSDATGWVDDYYTIKRLRHKVYNNGSSVYEDVNYQFALCDAISYRYSNGVEVREEKTYRIDDSSFNIIFSYIQNGYLQYWAYDWNAYKIVYI